MAAKSRTPSIVGDTFAAARQRNAQRRARKPHFARHDGRWFMHWYDCAGGPIMYGPWRSLRALQIVSSLQYSDCCYDREKNMTP